MLQDEIMCLLVKVAIRPSMKEFWSFPKQTNYRLKYIDNLLSINVTIDDAMFYE